MIVRARKESVEERIVGIERMEESPMAGKGSRGMGSGTRRPEVLISRWVGRI